MHLGKNYGQIVDHGLTKTKAGNIQIFIRFSLGDSGEEQTWYGSPFKKDTGEINKFCIQQLCYVGFDPATMELEDLNKDGTLDKSQLFDVYGQNQTQGDGSLMVRIGSLGPLGPERATAEEISTIVTSTQKQSLKELAGKYRASKPVMPVNKPDPLETIPF